MAEAVNLVVDRGVLFDIGVAGGNVGLRLIIIVIGDEILHRAVREKGLELTAQLGGQGLVVGDHQGGPLDPLDDGGHRKGLARAGNAQKHLGVFPAQHAVRQGLNGLGLVPAGLVGRF